MIEPTIAVCTPALLAAVVLASLPASVAAQSSQKPGTGIGAKGASVRLRESESSVRSIVDAEIAPLMARYDIPGMAVCLTIDGRHHVFNYGVASRQGRLPVDDRTRFEIGSITKVFTATLATYAQSAGRLSLDDRPGKYLAGLAGHPIDQATLLHLGTYTAGGLPLQFPRAIDTDREAMAFLQSWKPEAAPGKQRRYSNPSIGLLGEVTAVALGDRFSTLLEQRLLLPLNMRQTHVQVPEHALASYAWGERDGKAVRVNPGAFADATYGIKSTATDLLKVIDANIAPERFESRLATAIAATHVGRFRAGEMTQCLGWDRFAYPLSLERWLAGNSQEIIFESQPVQPVTSRDPAAKHLFSKTGSTGGFGAFVAFVPSQRIGLVILANRNYPIHARVEVAHQILSRWVY